MTQTDDLVEKLFIFSVNNVYLRCMQMRDKTLIQQVA